jgi:hypothetical protein
MGHGFDELFSTNYTMKTSASSQTLDKAKRYFELAAAKGETLCSWVLENVFKGGAKTREEVRQKLVGNESKEALFFCGWLTSELPERLRMLKEAAEKGWGELFFLFFLSFFLFFFCEDWMWR